MLGAVVFYGLLLLGCLYFWVSDNRPKQVSKPVEFIQQIEMPKKFVKFTRKNQVQFGPVHKSTVLPSWFCVKGVKPSAAEKLIIAELNKYRVKWYREVSFEKFPSSKYGHYRYDFLLPALKLVIEYDGKLWHQHLDRQKVDNLKDRFCAEHRISMKRYSSQDYYKMPLCIAELMKSYGVALA